MSVKAVMGLEWAINSLKNAFRSTGTRQRRLVVEFASFFFFFFPRGGGMGGTCNRYQRPDLGMSVKNATRFKTTIRGEMF